MENKDNTVETTSVKPDIANEEQLTNIVDPVPNSIGITPESNEMANDKSTCTTPFVKCGALLHVAEYEQSFELFCANLSQMKNRIPSDYPRSDRYTLKNTSRTFRNDVAPIFHGTYGAPSSFNPQIIPDTRFINLNNRFWSYSHNRKSNFQTVNLLTCYLLGTMEKDFVLQFLPDTSLRTDLSVKSNPDTTFLSCGHRLFVCLCYSTGIPAWMAYYMPEFTCGLTPLSSSQCDYFQLRHCETALLNKVKPSKVQFKQRKRKLRQPHTKWFPHWLWNSIFRSLYSLLFASSHEIVECSLDESHFLSPSFGLEFTAGLDMDGIFTWNGIGLYEAGRTLLSQRRIVQDRDFLYISDNSVPVSGIPFCMNDFEALCSISRTLDGGKTCYGFTTSELPGSELGIGCVTGVYISSGGLDDLNRSVTFVFDNDSNSCSLLTHTLPRNPFEEIVVADSPWERYNLSVFVKLIVALFLFDLGFDWYLLVLLGFFLHVAGTFDWIIEFGARISHNQNIEVTFAQLRQNLSNSVQSKDDVSQGVDGNYETELGADESVPCNIEGIDSSEVCGAPNLCNSIPVLNTVDESSVCSSSHGPETKSVSLNESDVVRATNSECISTKNCSVKYNSGNPGSSGLHPQASSIWNFFYQLFIMLFMTAFPWWNPNPSYLS